MSKLKICDLSFYEAKLPSHREVQGGIQELSMYLSEGSKLADFFSGLRKYSPKLGESSLREHTVLGEYTVEEFGDEKTGNYGYVMSNKEGTFLAGTAVGNLDNGGQYATSFSTMSTSSS